MRSHQLMTNETFYELKRSIGARGVSYTGAYNVLVHGLSLRAAAKPLPCNFQAVAQSVTRMRTAYDDRHMCPHCKRTIP